MSGIPPFRPIHTDDSLLSRIQQNITDAFSRLTNSPIAGGNLVIVDFSSLAPNTDLPVNHGLGTPKVDWLMGTQSTPGSVYISPNNNNAKFNPSPQTVILLRATVPMRAVLYFYVGPKIVSPTAFNPNQDVGPQGPEGPAGPTGPQGPVGPAANRYYGNLFGATPPGTITVTPVNTYLLVNTWSAVGPYSGTVPSLVSNNITLTNAGIYLATAQVACSWAASGTNYLTFALAQNTSNILATTQLSVNNGSYGNASLNASFSASAGDTLDLRVQGSYDGQILTIYQAGLTIS